jgi:hypothetical protein
MKKFVLNTWVLANCLHPIMFVMLLVILNLISPDPDGFSPDMIFLTVAAFSTGAMVLSIPCLWLSWCLTPEIVRSSKSLLTRFFIYLISGIAMVGLYGTIFWFFLPSDAGVFAMFIPAFAATIAAVCIRFRTFIEMAVEYDDSREGETK